MRFGLIPYLVLLSVTAGVAMLIPAPVAASDALALSFALHISPGVLLLGLLGLVHFTPSLSTRRGADQTVRTMEDVMKGLPMAFAVMGMVHILLSAAWARLPMEGWTGLSPLMQTPALLVAAGMATLAMLLPHLRHRSRA